MWHMNLPHATSPDRVGCDECASTCTHRAELGSTRHPGALPPAPSTIIPLRGEVIGEPTCTAAIELEDGEATCEQGEAHVLPLTCLDLT